MSVNSLSAMMEQYYNMPAPTTGSVFAPLMSMSTHHDRDDDDVDNISNESSSPPPPSSRSDHHPPGSGSSLARPVSLIGPTGHISSRIDNLGSSATSPELAVAAAAAMSVTASSSSYRKQYSIDGILGKQPQQQYVRSPISSGNRSPVDVSLKGKVFSLKISFVVAWHGSMTIQNWQ